MFKQTPRISGGVVYSFNAREVVNLGAMYFDDFSDCVLEIARFCPTWIAYMLATLDFCFEKTLRKTMFFEHHHEVSTTVVDAAHISITLVHGTYAYDA